MVKTNRGRKGQSMVEYAIGIGAVTAVCMLALGALGHAAGDVVRQVALNINDGDDQPGDAGSVFSYGYNPSAAQAPWNPQ